MDQLLANQNRIKKELYPLKGLVVLDRERALTNENKWILEPSVSSKNDDTEAFSSLLLAEHLKELDQTTPFKVTHNATMDRFIRVYLKNRQENLSLLMGKASYYFPVFEQYLDKFDLPLEIKYLAVVESALNPSAISPSGAKGLWQFMYGTGLEFGLHIDSYVDERYDYIKSTQAACAYLEKLFNTFNDWDLALAAYNSGPGNVKKAILRAGGKTDYWEIRQFLPKETQGYLPAFYATLYLFSYADYHGLKSQKPDINYYQTDTVHLKGSLKFENIEKSLGIETDLLKTLNPQYKKGLIPLIQGRQMTLSLPLNYMPRFLEKENDLYKNSDFLSKKSVESTIIPIKSDNSYTVQKGDNLQNIARRHHISVQQLKSWNGLQTDFLIEGQSLVITDKKIISSKETLNSAASAPNKTEKNKGKLIEYTVAYGDTLFKISRKLGNISIPQLRSWNKLSDVNYLKPGTILHIFIPEPSNEALSIHN
jgi:membrane-bound lytic murein transglycosylase D